MQRQYVASSRIRSVGWENEILEVEFNNGAVYQYFGVSEGEYYGFINSGSLGSAISTLDKVHRYTRIN
ncbi:KTSC domain-containing protein [Listeria monocytogenes]|nr:KTSC domain-containing protein [Listeria monocytogenes]HCY9089917.1 KTSC domain-containing protein [Listeria monocytogenes]